MTAAVEAPLGPLLRHHHARFSPRYGGYLSDHGPMAVLALLGLGADPDRAAGYLQRYRRRLEPMEEAAPAYRQHLAHMLEAVREVGAEALLARELPGLVSGWAKDAYHPLIRTAYGYEFGIAEEVAAGLAYLKWCGPDPALEARARRAAPVEAGALPDAFAAMQRCAARISPEKNFTACLREVIDHPAFAQAAVPSRDALRLLSRESLHVFASTHDFFALHLVTGSHAFRVLYPFAGEQRDAILTLGLLAGYAAAGAPPYTPPARAFATNPPADWLALAGDDEHAITLAYSARSQGRCFHDPTFEAAAIGYLRSPGTPASS